ncbi:MAG: ABC transporter ATP-binding protein [Rhodobacteraceae bacterium]|nr:ABC transporter ATP-binding protein [Paracoccaceae bacterium]
MVSLRNIINPFQPAIGSPPEKLYPFFLWSLSGAWLVIWLATLFSALSGIMDAFTALILGRVIDTAIALGPEAFFSSQNFGLIFSAIAFFLLIRPFVFWTSYASNSIFLTPNINPLVLSRLNRWVLGQSLTFFDNDFAGRIAQKQQQTARAITDVTVEMINVVAFALASLIGSLALLAGIDWRIAVSFFIWLVAYGFLIRWFMPRIRERAMARAGARASVSGQIVDTITNIKTVKLFAHDNHEDRAALTEMQTFREKALHFGQLSAHFRLSLMTLAGTLPLLLIGGTLLLWAHQEASAGDIVAAGTISIRIAQMTGWVSFSLMTIYADIGEVDDGMKTLAQKSRIDDRPDAVPLAIRGGEVRFEDVTFSYGTKTGGIKSLSLTVRPGEKLGIVGASGAGKSTLLYGRPDATPEQAIEAAQKAEAHAFILGLRDFRGRTGYEAYLGERGVKLSGGQRQRIALARAILKDAPILILDEATSALDSEVEASIQSALSKVMAGKTVLAIAHRLSTISQMDRIIVMDQGIIVEEGTHTELLEKKGLYTRYWERQSGGFIGLQDAEK